MRHLLAFEIDLCGRATLALAHVACTEAEPGRERVEFATVSGVLPVVRRGGTLWCAVSGETVKISGRAALYLRGQLCV